MEGVGDNDLLVAFDGTWAEDTHEKVRDDTVMSRLAREWPGHVLYVPGVGTRLGVLGRIFGGAFGLGGKGRVEEAEWGVENWYEEHPDAKLYVAGWSRGGVYAHALSVAVQETIVPTLTLLLDPVPGPVVSRWWREGTVLGRVVCVKAQKPWNPLFARMRIEGPRVTTIAVPGASQRWVGTSHALTHLVRALVAEGTRRRDR